MNIQQNGNKVKHTPGPWVVYKDINPLFKGVVAIIEHSPERFLCVGSDDDRATRPEEYEPSARLIAAAPDLLEALGAAAATLEFWASMGVNVDTTWNARAKVNAAIAKAIGEDNG